VYSTLDDWIQRDAISFSLNSPETFHLSADRLMASLGRPVELLGLGEALHGGEDILQLRNLLFSRLVEAHGFSAIAIESSFPRGRLVNDYISGRGPRSYQGVQEAGFSHGFGRLEANRELVEWMRAYNADSSHRVKLHFYGFDSPTEMTSTDSPSQVLHFVLDYLASIDHAGAEERRARIDRLLGPDSDWENPAAMFDPEKGVGLCPSASALRIETEDLITELQLRRPELASGSDPGRYWEAVHYAEVARKLLNYHAEVARDSRCRVARLLGIRDLMMADNLAYLAFAERGRGRVLAFAHNSHLQRGKAHWQLGEDLLTWWPAGAHLGTIFGSSYAVIGTGVGISAENGILPPESGTLESRILALSGPGQFVPTRRGQGLPAKEIADLPARSGSTKNPTYFPLTRQSFTDFDWLAVLDETEYSRGGPPLQ